MPKKGFEYIASSAAIRKAADVLSKKTGEKWTPAEIQETVWSWSYALLDAQGRSGEDRTALKILQDNDLTHEDITKVPDFAGLLLSEPYKTILQDAGYGSQVDQLRGLLKDQKLRGTVYDTPSARPHLNRAAKRLDKIINERRADAVRSGIVANLSVSTASIPILKKLTEDADKGDRQAELLLQETAADSLKYLTQNIPSVKVSFSNATGLYDRTLEPSLNVEISFAERDRDRTLSSLAKFGMNWNQEQVHVRANKEPRTPIGYKYDDGSYNTFVVKMDILSPLNRPQMQKAIDTGGLYGLTTVTDKYVMAYFVGDASNVDEITNFIEATERARKSLGRSVSNINKGVERLWAYGTGYGATATYGSILGNFQAPRQDQGSKTALRFASRIAGREIKETPPAPKTTPEKKALQERIADAHEDMSVNNLGDPLVSRSYEELALELVDQYDSMPIKVELWTKRDKNGNFTQPYKNSPMMRRDVLFNNHLYIYPTEVGSFGPPGVAYDNHPLLRDSGRTDINGSPMKVNDLLRAVHDYYAHSQSTAKFGATGEEAAWLFHMLMTSSP